MKWFTLIVRFLVMIGLCRPLFTPSRFLCVPSIWRFDGGSPGSDQSATLPTAGFPGADTRVMVYGLID